MMKWIVVLVAAYLVYRYRFYLATTFPALKVPLSYLPNAGAVSTAKATT